MSKQMHSCQNLVNLYKYKYHQNVFFFTLEDISTGFKVEFNVFPRIFFFFFLNIDFRVSLFDSPYNFASSGP